VNKEKEDEEEETTLLRGMFRRALICDEQWLPFTGDPLFENRPGKEIQFSYQPACDHRTLVAVQGRHEYRFSTLGRHGILGGESTERRGGGGMLGGKEEAMMLVQKSPVTRNEGLPLIATELVTC
jgi:hypothetical protein